MNAQLLCALCRLPHPLKKSHIIPEFLYKPLYDEKHRFNAYGSAGASVVIQQQKGTREHLLCLNCEAKFCEYERFAADFFHGALRIYEGTNQPEAFYGKALKFSRLAATLEGCKLTNSKVPNVIQIEGVDYKLMKLFLLSLIWRMGASSLYFFREVELGPHLERLRVMLNNDDPGEPDQYACQMMLIEASGRLLTDWQSQPRKFRDQGKTFYSLMTTGFRLEFCVSDQRIDPGKLEFFCLKRRPIYNLWVDSIHQYPDLVEELLKVGCELNWVEEKDAEQAYSQVFPLKPHSHFAAFHYCIAAINEFSGMSHEQIQSLVFEITGLGHNLDVNSAETKYRLKSKPGEFTGLELACYLYVGFRQISPGRSTGWDLLKDYEAAKAFVAGGS
jgi:hypothetical protein